MEQHLLAALRHVQQLLPTVQLDPSLAQVVMPAPQLTHLLFRKQMVPRHELVKVLDYLVRWRQPPRMETTLPNYSGSRRRRSSSRIRANTYVFQRRRRRFLHRTCNWRFVRWEFWPGCRATTAGQFCFQRHRSGQSMGRT